MRLRNTVLICVLVVFSGWTGYYFGQNQVKIAFKNWKPALVVNKLPTTAGKPSETDFSRFWTVWERVSQLYVDKTELDPKKMVDGAISGMVAAIGDPYTIYLPFKQNEESKEDLGGAFEGVGIQLGFKDKQLAVMTPLTGTPADKAGIKAGDLILKITDKQKEIDRETAGISLPEAVQLIRGKKGTTVTLTMLKPDGEKPYTIDLVRDTIVVKSVTLEMKEDVAVVTLSRFGDRTREEWDGIVNQLTVNNSQLKGVILDLRNNPGGYLELAVYVAGEFLKPGQIVVSQQYGDGTKIDNKVDRNGRLLKTKLVILVNEGSASAAEILAGALQDYKRAKVVGAISFGKGSVQQPEDLSDGSGIHVTVAKWLRPSGEWIDKKGIEPDYKVEENGEDNQLKKALDLL